VRCAAAAEGCAWEGARRERAAHQAGCALFLEFVKKRTGPNTEEEEEEEETEEAVEKEDEDADEVEVEEEEEEEEKEG
jgi:hypothetical protein